MNLITRFFGHADTLSADIERLHAEHEQHMDDYVRSFQRKRDLSGREFDDDVRLQLSIQLQHEMPLAEKDEATEAEIVADLENYGYERRADGLKQLVYELNNYETQEAFIHRLMARIFEILKDEAVILQRLERNPSNSRLHDAFRMNIQHEEELLTELHRKGKGFAAVYKRLAEGERYIHKIHEHEKEASQEIWDRMQTEMVQKGVAPVSEDAFHVLTVDCVHQFDIELEKEMTAGRIGSTFQSPFEYLHSRFFEAHVRDVVRKNRIQLEHNAVQQEDAVRIFIFLFRQFFEQHLRQWGE